MLQKTRCIKYIIFREKNCNFTNIGLVEYLNNMISVKKRSEYFAQIIVVTFVKQMLFW